MNKRAFAFLLVLTLGSFNAKAQDYFEMLASPRGVAITTLTYGFFSAVSNFMWSFRWDKHLGFSDALTAQIQEAGGLSASAENIVLGVVIPAMVWGYVSKQQREQEEPRQTFFQFIRGKKAEVPDGEPGVGLATDPMGIDHADIIVRQR